MSQSSQPYSEISEEDIPNPLQHELRGDYMDIQTQNSRYSPLFIEQINASDLDERDKEELGEIIDNFVEEVIEEGNDNSSISSLRSRVSSISDRTQKEQFINDVFAPFVGVSQTTDKVNGIIQNIIQWYTATKKVALVDTPMTISTIIGNFIPLPNIQISGANIEQFKKRVKILTKLFQSIKEILNVNERQMNVRITGTMRQQIENDLNRSMIDLKSNFKYEIVSLKNLYLEVFKEIVNETGVGEKRKRIEDVLGLSETLDSIESDMVDRYPTTNENLFKLKLLIQQIVSLKALLDPLKATDAEPLRLYIRQDNDFIENVNFLNEQLKAFIGEIPRKILRASVGGKGKTKKSKGGKAKKQNKTKSKKDRKTKKRRCCLKVIS